MCIFSTGTRPFSINRIAESYALVVTPNALTISVDQFETLDATALDRFGHPLQRAITWSSSNPDVAIVNGAGRVRGVAPGLVEITAAVGDVTGTARIRVTQ